MVLFPIFKANRFQESCMRFLKGRKYAYQTANRPCMSVTFADKSEATIGPVYAMEDAGDNLSRRSFWYQSIYTT